MVRITNHAQETMSFSDAYRQVYKWTDSELDFKQCSFHLVTQVLQDDGFSVFSPSPTLPPCYSPLHLSDSGKAVDLRRFLRLLSGSAGDTVLLIAAHDAFVSGVVFVGDHIDQRLDCHGPTSLLCKTVTEERGQGRARTWRPCLVQNFGQTWAAKSSAAFLRLVLHGK